MESTQASCTAKVRHPAWSNASERLSHATLIMWSDDKSAMGVVELPKQTSFLIPCSSCYLQVHLSRGTYFTMPSSTIWLVSSHKLWLGSLMPSMMMLFSLVT